MTCKETQGFYDNATDYYKRQGMNGHGGIDIVCGYGTAIESPVNGYVYKIIDDKRPASDGSGYWAIFIIADYNGQLYEVCVGHCSAIMVNVKDIIKKGDILGTEGNHGIVYSGGIQITKAMQDAGDTRGSHRHWQARAIKKVSMTSKKGTYLSGFVNMVYRELGTAFEIVNYSNGFHGLVPTIKNMIDDYDLDKKVDHIVPSPTPTSTNAEIQGKINEIERSYFQLKIDWLKTQLNQLLAKIKK